ncbi:MAG: PCRF domain-containing protein, partial [Synergistaceae bacterium]|nr:PCRF domain-containing protein [Synergistaceae bacterium]
MPALPDSDRPLQKVTLHHNLCPGRLRAGLNFSVCDIILHNQFIKGVRKFCPRISILNQNWKNCIPHFRPCRTAFDLPALTSRSQELTRITSEPDFWTQDGHEDTLRELSDVNAKLDTFRHIESEYEDLAAIEEILRDTEDPELQAEFTTRAGSLRTELERQSLLLLLNDPYDGANAILMIHAGSGGLDSQ